MRLLLVEDDLQLGAALEKALRSENLRVQWVRRVADAEPFLHDHDYAVVLLDVGLPDGSGLDLLRTIRRRNDRVPVLILTAYDAVDDRVRGLSLGADDYLTKPFAIPELIARIHALARRSAGFATQIWRVGMLSVDPTRRRVGVRHNGNESEVALSPTQFALLLELVQANGRVLTRAHLENVMSTHGNGPESNSLEVHIHHLRKKIGDEFIRTIRGVGYMIVAPTEE